MSYQRGNNLDKDIIFQEYFNDEQSVRRNGGVPTDVVFDKGVAEFNGNTSVIDYGNQLSIQSGDGFSVRIQAKKAISIEYGSLLDIDTYTTFEFRIDHTTNYFTVYLNSVKITNGESLPDDEWLDLIYTFDGIDQHNLYVDGELVNNTVSSVSSISLNKNLLVGERSDGSLDGDQDQRLLEIYNKILNGLQSWWQAQ